MKEPVWIDEQDALTIHDRLLALHGGPSGVRDKTLLSSASFFLSSTATGLSPGKKMLRKPCSRWRQEPWMKKNIACFLGAIPYAKAETLPDILGEN